MCQTSSSSKSVTAAEPIDIATQASISVSVIKPAKKYVHSVERSEYVDILCFLAPALFMGLTDVTPIFITGLMRVVATHAFLTFHYLCVDKDNYNMKLQQKQLAREKKDYMTGAILHMWAQIVLQILFPGMFFTPNDKIASCAVNTLLAHILLVEPLYYTVHRWLHVPEHMKAMHSFHHLSINTLPSTSLVQDFSEHFIYIATFGPAMLAPYFLCGCNHWLVVAAYLVMFDMVNAYGHTNIICRNWVFESKWSPMRYLFYTPEFHLGHHAYYNNNFALFMPIWDHLLSTYREYKKPNKLVQPQLPLDQQDFVFIGHNGGLGHLLTCPEISPYNVYDQYVRTWLPLSVEFLIAHLVACLCSIFASSYSLSRYLVDEKYIGRIRCVWRTPIDYMTQSRYAGVNRDIVALIKTEHKSSGTRYFGLGNLNKMKQLNDGGSKIVDMIAEDEYLRDKNIRIWTGDTLTAASVYNQLLAIPDLKKVFFIGANGKIGKAVCQKLVERNIQICIFSSYVGFTHPLVSYTQDLSEAANYQHVLVGKMISPGKYTAALTKALTNDKTLKTRHVLDYTVPFMPLGLEKGFGVRHSQIGVLQVGTRAQGTAFSSAATTNTTTTTTTVNTTKGVDPSSRLLRGHFDVCMSTDENQIFPCHMGCILNLLNKRESNETGEIDISEMDRLWDMARREGIDNRVLSE